GGRAAQAPAAHPRRRPEPRRVGHEPVDAVPRAAACDVPVAAAAAAVRHLGRGPGRGRRGRLDRGPVTLPAPYDRWFADSPIDGTYGYDRDALLAVEPAAEPEGFADLWRSWAARARAVAPDVDVE